MTITDEHRRAVLRELWAWAKKYKETDEPLIWIITRFARDHKLNMVDFTP